MLGQRRRRRANIKTALFQRVVFAGYSGTLVNIRVSGGGGGGGSDAQGMTNTI